MQGIGALLGAIDRFFRGLVTGIRDGVKGLATGPLQGVLFALVLTLTGVLVVIQAVWRWIDRGMGIAERVLIVAATLA